MAGVCTAKHIDHTCIAVSNIEDSLKFFQDTFGIGPAEIELVPDQGVRASYIKVGSTHLELIQPVDPQGAIARFLGDRQSGLHHVCFEVDKIADKLKALEKAGMRLIDKAPRRGLAGMIGFIHPSASRGILIELAEKVR